MAEAKTNPTVAGELLGEDSPADIEGEESPVRDDHVANAVQFLVHPKVQNASIEERRKFLAKKGLTSRGGCHPVYFISCPFHI